MINILTKGSWTSALIADGDQYFRIALSAILSDKFGVKKVHHAASLDEALELLGKETPSVAIFDLMLPGMRGAASLAPVREMLPAMKMVVASASRRRQDALDALQAGAHGYVPKAFEPDELVKALRFVMDGMIFVPASVAEAATAPLPLMDRRAPVIQNGLSSLTPRQRDVLGLLIKGQSNKEIARALDLGEGTVKIHLAALFRALKVRNRAAAAVAGHEMMSMQEDDAEIGARPASPRPHQTWLSGPRYQ